MNATTIYTKDIKNNNVVYSTTDKLYLGYGVSGDGYITVGTNSSDNDDQKLNNGFRVDKEYWGSAGIFWIRAPSLYMFESWVSLMALPGHSVSADSVNFDHALVPLLN